MEFPILYQDEHYVAIHKPPNILVHRTAMSKDTCFVLQELRNQLGQRLYPVHRLDRATAGVLVFALSSTAAEALARQFREQTIEKVYWLIVRGWTADTGCIEHPVKINDLGERKEGITHYQTLAKIELPVAVDRYPSSRYSLVEARPKTGRRHQIRQHFKHISHHLIGDTSYGKGTHNQFFREQMECSRLLLLSRSLRFWHPYTDQSLLIHADFEPEWLSLFIKLDWES